MLKLENHDFEKLNFCENNINILITLYSCLFKKAVHNTLIKNTIFKEIMVKLLKHKLHLIFGVMLVFHFILFNHNIFLFDVIFWRNKLQFVQ
jgi:hypothetical protein